MTHSASAVDILIFISDAGGKKKKEKKKRKEKKKKKKEKKASITIPLSTYFHSHECVGNGKGLVAKKFLHNCSKHMCL